MNKIILIGNLTRDPELSETPSGTAYCRFSIAVNRDFANADGEKETDFFNIVAWKGLAETIGKFMAKGRKIAIVGRLQNRSYEDKDGVKRTVTEIVANEVEFLSAGGEQNNEKKKDLKLEPVTEEEEDNLPF